MGGLVPLAAGAHASLHAAPAAPHHHHQKENTMAAIVGDVVHYYTEPTAKPIAGIVTQVHPDGVSLDLFLPPLSQATTFRDEHIPHSDQPTARHWTERPTS